MAESDKDDKTVGKQKKTAKSQTVRERTQTAGKKQPRRLKRTAGHIKKPLSLLPRVGKMIRIPLPNNRIGRIIRKAGSLIGRIFLLKFFREAWKEIRQVTWPNRRETIRLTMAVFIFALIFAVIVGFLDFGLDKIFKKVIVDNE